jgi:hypothetical protein
MNLNYNADIPAANNNPSDDQPLMLTNTNSTRSWVTIDHFGFEDNNGGLHKQTRIINQLAIPANLTTSMGTIYTKLATSTGALKESNIFFTPGTSGNEYQITRVITASFALFGALTANYNGVGANFSGGWTFLPGGLLFQYGSVSLAAGHAGQQIVKFPIQFSTSNIVPTATAITSTNSSQACNIVAATISSTQFNVFVDVGSSFKGFTWSAIGK